MRLTSARDLKRSIVASDEWRSARSEDRARMAIGVSVGKKPDDYRLAIRARAPEDVDGPLLERIRTESANEIDLRYTGPVEIGTPDEAARAKRVALGGSVGHYLGSAGTIGFFARRIEDGSLGIVSNNHILAAEDRGKDEDEILHPGPFDRGLRPNDVVAYLAGDYPRLHTPERKVDCAFARLASERGCDPLEISHAERLRPTIALAEEQLEVVKVGRTTCRTIGRITTIDLDFFDVDYRFGRLSFYDQIEIESVDETPFCRGGDSGSLVFTRDCEPVGLLFINTRAGGAFNTGRGYANPIGEVMNALRVTFA